MEWDQVNQTEQQTPRAHRRDNRTPPNAESLFEAESDSPQDQWQRANRGWLGADSRKRPRVADVDADWTNPTHDPSEDEVENDDGASDTEDSSHLCQPCDDNESDEENLANAASAMDFEQGVRNATQRLGLERANCDTAGCWGCQYGATMHTKEGDNPKVAQIIRLIRDNHGRMEDRELARIVARHHKEYIRKPALAAGVQCARWTKVQILRHIRHHTLDPTIVFAENIRTLRGVVRMLKERATQVDVDTGESTVNHRNIDLLIKTIRGMSDLYTKRAHELLFGPSPNQPDYLINPNKS